MLTKYLRLLKFRETVAIMPKKEVQKRPVKVDFLLASKVFDFNK